jgi:hypothetical protein
MEIPRKPIGEEQNMRSKLMGSIVALFVAFGASQGLHAQSSEAARTQLLNLIDASQELGPIAPASAFDSNRLQNERLQIEQMAPADLVKIGAALAPLNLSERLAGARSTMAAYSNSVAGKTAAGVTSQLDTATFPVANGFCTSANGADTNRLPTSVVLAADVTYFVAEGVKDAATDACNEVVVALGEGGNGSLACEITDAIYVTAHAVDEGIHFCDDDLTGAVIDANYARLDYINTNLNGVDTDVTNGFSGVGTEISNSSAQIATEFATLNTHISGLIGALSTQLTKDTIPTSGSSCNGIYGGVFPGNLTVHTGENCVIVSGGVTGDVQIDGGTLTVSNATYMGGDVKLNSGTLTLSNSHVRGSVEINGGTFTLGPGLTIADDLQINGLPSTAGTYRVCGTIVGNNLQFQNNRSAALIGSPTASPACAGNMVGSSLTVSNNRAATTVDNNTVTDNLTVSNNSGATTVDSNTVTANLTDENNTAATKVFTNVVGKDLQCQHDTTITGGGNTAKSKHGQCAAF